MVQFKIIDEASSFGFKETVSDNKADYSNLEVFGIEAETDQFSFSATRPVMAALCEYYIASYNDESTRQN